jgi:hypothetical protein
MVDLFYQFMATNDHIRERNLPYYVKWVSECYAYLLTLSLFYLTIGFSPNIFKRRYSRIFRKEVIYAGH